jgi:hypothetical protein
MEFHRFQTQSFTYTNNLLPTAITVAVSLFEFQNENIYRIV